MRRNDDALRFSHSVVWKFPLLVGVTVVTLYVINTAWLFLFVYFVLGTYKSTAYGVDGFQVNRHPCLSDVAG